MPSIAVLPFQNMSADVMVEDIITGLSRTLWLFVIPRNSSFTYKGQAVDVKRVAASWACAMCSEARCASWARGAASPRNCIALILGSTAIGWPNEAERTLEWGERAAGLSPFDPLI